MPEAMVQQLWFFYVHDVINVMPYQRKHLYLHRGMHRYGVCRHTKIIKILTYERGMYEYIETKSIFTQFRDCWLLNTVQCDDAYGYSDD